MEVLIVSKSFIIREALEVFFSNEFINYNVKGIKDIVEIKNIDLNKIKFMFFDIEGDIFNSINLIKESFNHIKIMVFDKGNNKNNFIKSFNGGIDGYIVEIPDKEDLVYIVKKILKGKQYYDAELLQYMVHDNQDNMTILTNREKEVLKEVRKGLTNKEIAKYLYITEHTIKKHITSILSKLDMKNRKELIIYSKDELYNII